LPMHKMYDINLCIITTFCTVCAFELASETLVFTNICAIMSINLMNEEMKNDGRQLK
jgi:hypothetical protein